MFGNSDRWKNFATLIVPTLCVGMPPLDALRPAFNSDAERHRMHSHAERGNDQVGVKARP
ncbi:hypothetical protein EUX57_02565 [Pseudomonas orientalis]|uniref:Uncharacterized protein n=1 Tax=Pseudomonas orientalis TaxID=76758 RepID=A0A4Q7D4D6_9PSED|nr:hypothetical protein EUX57_02565 [Pseudomonas orientalis]